MPEECYNELLCAAIEQLKLYEQPIAAGAPPSPGNASIWASEMASAPRIDRQWAYNGTTRASRGRADLDPLLARQNPVSPCRQVPYQGLQATRVDATPVRRMPCPHPTHPQDRRTPESRPCNALPTGARPLSPTMPPHSSPARTRTTP